MNHVFHPVSAIGQWSCAIHFETIHIPLTWCSKTTATSEVRGSEHCSDHTIVRTGFHLRRKEARISNRPPSTTRQSWKQWHWYIFGWISGTVLRIYCPIWEVNEWVQNGWRKTIALLHLRDGKRDSHRNSPCGSSVDACWCSVNDVGALKTI